MTDTLRKYFVTEDFNPEKFVKDLGSQCIGADELRQQRAKIQELADNTSALLKRNVYQNYIQFIETAKEISHLEIEMYQLSQLLSDQQSLLSIFATNQNTGILFEDNFEIKSKSHSGLEFKEEESKLKLIKLLENVDGAMSLIEVPGRICLYEGSLLELDPLEGIPIRRIHAYLFNDILMIALWLTNGNRRGPPRYKMQIVYDLQSLAIVNVRDLGTVKLAFKLLSFTDTRVFQCASAITKKEWLEKCDQAKKLKMSQDIQVKTTNVEKSNEINSTNPFCQSISLKSYDIGNKINTELEYNESIPEWMLEITEDLDSCIAQRHFEKANNLLQKAKLFLKNMDGIPQLNEINLKLNNRACSLINILTKELELSVEAKSFQGDGLRNARRAVKLLIELDHSAQACQSYLKLCSAALKVRLTRVKREGTTVPYVKQLSAIAFNNIAEISQEFLKIFSQNSNYNSALVVWCSHELKVIVSHLIKQMFIPQVPLNTLVECIIMIRNHCKQLTHIGMDFRYQLDGQLRLPLSRALHDTAEKYMDAIRVRASEDSWRPSNFETNQNFLKLVSEFDNLGIPLPKSYIKNEYWIPLTNNTIIFAKLYVGLLEDCLNVTTPEIVYIIDEVLISVLQIQIQHIQSSLLNSKLKQEKKLIQDNAKYVYGVIIARSLELYKSVTGQQFKKLLILQEQFFFETLSVSTRPKPAPRTSVTKYSTTEFL